MGQQSRRLVERKGSRMSTCPQTAPGQRFADARREGLGGRQHRAGPTG